MIVMDRTCPISAIVVDEVTYWFSVPGVEAGNRMVTLPRLQAERRDYPFAEARKCLIWLLCDYGISECAVAALLGRTQGTISHARRDYAALLAYDFETQRDVRELQQRIGARIEQWRQQSAATGTHQRPRRVSAGAQGRHTAHRGAAGLDG